MENSAINSTQCAEWGYNFAKLVDFKSFPFDPRNCTHVIEFVKYIWLRKSIEDGAKFSIMYIAIAVPLLFLQLTTLPIFLLHKNYRSSICYRILFFNAITDAMQLATILTYSFLNLYMLNISDYLQNIGGAIIIVTWSLMVMQHFLLALNRLSVIMRARYTGCKYIPDEKNEHRIFNIALFFSWLLFFAAFALYYSGLAGSILDRGTMVFRFDTTRPYTATYQQVIWYLTSWIPWICLFIYGIIIWMAKKIRTVQPSIEICNSKEVQNDIPPLLNQAERRLLIQAIVLYTFMAIFIFDYNLIDRCDIGFLQSTCTAHVFGYEIFHISLPWYSLVVETPWMFYCGLSAILMLTMNREFRTRYVQLYTRKSTKELGQMLTAVTSLDSRAKEEEKSASSEAPHRRS